MEPLIPDGAYCLYGKILLVAYRGKADPVYDGAYTVKRYRSAKRAAENGEWEHADITLEPLNAEFDPIVLTPRDEGDVRVVAEFVQVVE